MQQLPKFLYKYMPAKRIDFFDTPKIRFTPPEEFNDIFDCKVRIKGVCSDEYIAAEVHKKINEEFEQIINYTISTRTGIPLHFFKNAMSPQMKRYMEMQIVPILHQNGEAAIPRIQQELGKTAAAQAIHDAIKRNRMGVLCLTADYTNTVMWGIYAVDNKGFVVGFDTAHSYFHRQLHSEDHFRHLVQVAYPQHRTVPYIVDYNELENGGTAFVKDLIYTKDFRWSYEEEWRMVIQNASTYGEQIVGLETIPTEMIKAIYLGAMSDNDLQQAATVFCKRHNISLFKMIPTVEGTLNPEQFPLL